MDRREFLCTTAFTVGGITVATVLPMPAFGSESAASESIYSIDDACGHWPPYSHPIPYGRPEPEPLSLAHVDPIDHVFMV